MTDARAKVLEDQFDEMVGRVARLEEEVRILRSALSRPRVLEILELAKSDLELVLARSFAAAEQSRSRLARITALAAARKDRLLDRLDMAERIAERTGQTLSDAWTAVGKENG